MSTQQQIERLKAQIADQEAELADLESAILDIENELEEFNTRYEALIVPLQDKISLIDDMIADIEKEQRINPRLYQSPDTGSRWTTWQPPSGYVSVEEQYRQTWEAHRDAGGFDEDFQAIPTAAADLSNEQQELKKLYRQLARRFHPDLTTDPAERERRNRLMVEINAAYSDHDADALRVLAAQPDDAQIDQPIAMLQLRQLEQIQAQLARRIGELRFRRSELFNGERMSLKIQASLAAHEGRDLLQEMVAQLERDYRARLDRLDQLRSQGN